MLNLPNKITLSRILLMPALIILAIQAEQGVAYRYAVLGLFALLAATDALDGFLARALKQKTELGAFLDPLADKILLTITCVLLALPLWLDPDSSVPHALLRKWIVVLVLGRDVYLAAGGLSIFILTGQLSIRASLLGKLTTNAQVAMLLAALLPQCPAALKDALIWVAAGSTVLSWLQYTVAGSRQLAKASDASEREPARRQTLLERFLNS